MHEIINGIEVVYILDVNTGWIEGMNENGRGIVNSTLSKSEEREVIIKNKNNYILTALTCKNKQTLLDTLQKVEGNTILTENDNVYHIENNPKINKDNKYNIVDKIKSDTVYSNHSTNVKDVGYTSGRKGVSSFLRRKIIENELRKKKKINFDCKDKLYEEVSNILNRNYVNIDPRFHPYRDKNITVKLKKIPKNKRFVSTTGQIILNTTDKVFMYRKDFNNSEKLEYINNLPSNYKPKITVLLKETEKHKTPHKMFTKKFLQSTYKHFKFTNKNNKTKKVHK
jgi:hypothetical protein